MNLNDDATLNEQLDELIAQVRSAEPVLVKAALQAAEQGHTIEISSQPPLSDEDGVKTSTPPPPATPLAPAEEQASASSSDQELAVQIQNLLDDAEPSPKADTTPPPQQQPSDEGDTDEQAMEAIDDMLADSAEDAVAGEFETVSDLLAVAESKEEQASPAHPQPAPSAETSDPAPHPRIADDSDQIEGAFEKPEEVMAPDHGAKENPITQPPLADESDGYQADADNVAMELDEQLETAPREPSDPRTEQQHSAAPDASADEDRSTVVILADALKSTCRIVNMPLAPLSPGTQTMVGYIGLQILFFGTLLCGYSLLKVFLTG